VPIEREAEVLISFKEGLSERLQYSRKSAGLTQVSLARASGVPQNTISRIELGRNDETSTGTLKKLALALNVSTDYLLGLKDDPE
jgi:transcriptional regulator with XRE-family HTH domain